MLLGNTPDQGTEDSITKTLRHLKENELDARIHKSQTLSS